MSAHTVVVGSGYVGRRFVARRSADVTSLNRPGFDLDQAVAWPGVPEPYSVVYAVPPSRESLDDIRLQRLLECLAPIPERFVYISTTGVYGNHDGATVNEETPANPESERAQRRVSAENQVSDFGHRHGMAVVVLRVPGIYGPGRLGIERIEQGLPIIREADAGPGNRIHVDDLVTCCDHALLADIPAGIYNVGDGDDRSSNWFTNEVARQSGLAAPPEITMADAEREFSPMRMSFLRESRRVNTQKMRDVLGVTPTYPDAADGIAATLEEQGRGRGGLYRK